MIGIGIYLEDINHYIEIQKSILRRDLIQIVLLFFLIFIIYLFISNFIIKRVTAKVRKNLYIMSSDFIKAADMALKKNEFKYHQLINNTSEGVLMTDKNFKTVGVNGALCSLLGYEPSEIIGKIHCDFLDEVNQQTRKI